MECNKSFESIKAQLVSVPVFSCQEFSLLFVMHTNASMVCSEGEKEVCYAYRLINRLERNYSTIERECLGIIFAIEKFRPYTEVSQFTVITDHPSLKWLNIPSNRPVDWLAGKISQQNIVRLLVGTTTYIMIWLLVTVF